MKRLFGLLAALALVFNLSVALAAQAPLTSLGLDIVGVGLQASPEYQAVPKGIATQVVTGIDAQGFDTAAIISQLPKDYRVKAELSGPAFSTPITLETLPGKPFDIPTLALYGKHTLNNIRLVDGAGTTLFGAVPQAVIIESISDPLITEVKTRQLTVEELQERGVTFDSSNFTAYEFTAGIATESGQVPLTLPVLIPQQSTAEGLWVRLPSCQVRTYSSHNSQLPVHSPAKAESCPINCSASDSFIRPENFSDALLDLGFPFHRCHLRSSQQRKRPGKTGGLSCFPGG